MVKYGLSPRAQAIFHCISQVESQYRHYHIPNKDYNFNCNSHLVPNNNFVPISHFIPNSYFVIHSYFVPNLQ